MAGFVYDKRVPEIFSLLTNECNFLFIKKQKSAFVG
jgi:hypothetical protein